MFGKFPVLVVCGLKRTWIHQVFSLLTRQWSLCGSCWTHWQGNPLSTIYFILICLIQFQLELRHPMFFDQYESCSWYVLLSRNFGNNTFCLLAIKNTLDTSTLLLLPFWHQNDLEGGILWLRRHNYIRLQHQNLGLPRSPALPYPPLMLQGLQPGGCEHREPLTRQLYFMEPCLHQEHCNIDCYGQNWERGQDDPIMSQYNLLMWLLPDWWKHHLSMRLTPYWQQ